MITVSHSETIKVNSKRFYMSILYANKYSMFLIRSNSNIRKWNVWDEVNSIFTFVHEFEYCQNLRLVIKQERPCFYFFWVILAFNLTNKDERNPSLLNRKKIPVSSPHPFHFSLYPQLLNQPSPHIQQTFTFQEGIK